MRVIRAADCRRMPWKNGGGETVEIAVHPEGAGLGDFAWRFSTARVAQDGPFSLFPGIDRTLAVLSGGGMELRIDGHPRRLGAGDAPLSFSGDALTEARLLGGPVEDLNIMTRRTMARHSMRRVEVRAPATLDVSGTIVLVFCAQGGVSVEGTVLDARDTFIVSEAATRALSMKGRGALHVIAIDVEQP